MSNEPTTPLSSAMDEAEPTAGRGAAPILLIAVFAVLVFLALLYLDSRAGGFDARVYQPYGSYEDLQGKQPPTVGGDVLIQGKIVFQTCAQCHQADGKGSPALYAPPLAGSDWLQAEGPNRVIRIVLNGLTGPVTVNGQQYGGGTMTAFGPAFTDEQIAAVISYERHEWGNKAWLVKPEQVKAIRAKIASKTDSWTAPDLLQIPDKD